MTNRKPRRTRKRNGPHPVDVHVGQVLRDRRVLAGLSQTELARRLDLTFQQLQKYERGANRVSASRLWEISVALEFPVASFFEGLAAATEPKTPRRGITARRTMNLVRNIDRCPKVVREQMESMARAFARSASTTH